MLLTEHAVTVAATLVCVAMHGATVHADTCNPEQQPRGATVHGDAYNPEQQPRGATVHADTYNPEQQPRGERLPRCWALLS